MSQSELIIQNLKLGLPLDVSEEVNRKNIS